jgi:hypothetical protein
MRVDLPNVLGRADWYHVGFELVDDGKLAGCFQMHRCRRHFGERVNR